MSRPATGKSRTCAYPGCKVHITFAAQPRRFTIGLCRKHEVEMADAPRDRVADRGNVRQVLVQVGVPGNGYGELIQTRVSLPKETWL